MDYCDSITMYFKDKRVAQLNLHQESFLSNCAVISGDKGNIEVSFSCFSNNRIIAKFIELILFISFIYLFSVNCRYPNFGVQIQSSQRTGKRTTFRYQTSEKSTSSTLEGSSMKQRLSENVYSKVNFVIRSYRPHA